MAVQANSENSSCIAKIINNWRSLFSVLNISHPIYPLEPIAPLFSEFIVIDSKIRIRCIHINPESLRKSVLNNQFATDQTKSKRNSLAEEYWFSKWNKPLKIGNCNCSFRRSLRLSTISIQPFQSSNVKSQRFNFDNPPPKIIDVATFTERLLHETFYEAFQEYYMLQEKESNGTLNLAFESNEEIDCTVTLRKKNFQLNKLSVKNNNVTNDHNNSLANGKDMGRKQKNEFSRCNHNKAGQKKPIVLLFHGIGTSSDVWWVVINNLVSKGYEIVAPDMLGHGFSSAPDKEKSYTFNNLLLHALAIFDNYVGSDENRKCILIGHSYGCSFVTALYRHRTVQISQIILISGGGPTPLAAPVKEHELADNTCFQIIVQPLLFCGVNRSLFYTSRGKHFDTCDPNIGAPNHILQYIRIGQNWPEGDAAFHRRIFVPTLLVHGLQDKQITLVQECEMERTIPRAFLELISNAGHMSMLETPEHLTHMILCFLDCWS